MDSAQYGDFRTRVSMSISTGVGPDWRRLMGTILSR